MAMLEYAVKLTHEPAAMSALDIDNHFMKGRKIYVALPVVIRNYLNPCHSNIVSRCRKLRCYSWKIIEENYDHDPRCPDQIVAQ